MRKMMKNTRNVLIVLLFITVDLIHGNTLKKTNCQLVRCRSLESQQNATNPLELGERYVIDESGCCPVTSVICDSSLCPPEITECNEEFYEVNVKNGKCCREYSCQPPKTKCMAKTNGVTVLKEIGDEWYSTDPCVRHKCIKVEEYLAFDLQEVQTCPTACAEGFHLKPQTDSCCPKCEKSHCAFEDKYYQEGDSWKSANNCTFYECEMRDDKYSVVSYKKYCPKMPANCLEENIYWEDCCQYCKTSKRKDTMRSHNSEGSEIDYMDADTYKSHPCHRDCLTGQEPMICSYTFLVEWYETLSKACYDCPNNMTDCNRPHCIAADGVRRTVLVVNRMMPGPTIEVCQGDIISVDVKNHLMGDSTTIHWHGAHQRETPYMDGVPHISQCPIAPGTTFRYTFKAKEAGTHFWHSHTGMQRGDGAFGALIVRKPNELEVNSNLYNYDMSEHVIILQDWAHQTGVSMFSSHHHSIGDNKPPNILINGKGKYFLRREKNTSHDAAADPPPIDVESTELEFEGAQEITESGKKSKADVSNDIEIMQINNTRNSRLISAGNETTETPTIAAGSLATTEASVVRMNDENETSTVAETIMRTPLAELLDDKSEVTVTPSPEEVLDITTKLPLAIPRKFKQSSNTTVSEAEEVILSNATVTNATLTQLRANESRPRKVANTTSLLPEETIMANPALEVAPVTSARSSERILKREKRSDISDESMMVPYQVFNVVKGNNYRFRLINAEFLNCPMELSIDGHNITVIASDGSDFQPITVSTFISYAGERFDFVLNANQDIDNYWLRIRGLMDCDERFTSAYQVAILRYMGAPDASPASIPTYDYVRDGIQLNALNRGTGETSSVSIAELKAIAEDDPRLMVDKPDYKFYVYYDFYPKDNPHFHVPNLYGFNQIQNNTKKLFTPQLNHISMKMPALPFMPSKDQQDDSNFCNETSLKAQGIDCREEFCECSHVIQVKLNSVVEMVLIDEGYTYDANHPFHLHGNAFRVVAMERLSRNVTIEGIKALDAAGKIKRNLKNAPIKDTITIPDGGYTIIRFIADNPGYWLFHCHIEFHAEIGMSLVLKVGEHNEMRNVPDNFPTCHDYMPKSLEHNSIEHNSAVDVFINWFVNIPSLIFVIISSYCSFELRFT